jgi:hypothetical protein
MGEFVRNVDNIPVPRYCQEFFNDDDYFFGGKHARRGQGSREPAPGSVTGTKVVQHGREEFRLCGGRG